MNETAELRRAVLAWRRDQRAALIAARIAMPTAMRRPASRAIGERLGLAIEAIRPLVLGAYWPIKREFDPLPFLREQIGAGVPVALPTIGAKNQPLEFRLWHPGAKMAIGMYNIPYPADGGVVIPDALLIPMVGFDGSGFRLGYGGGYYDRTLAAFSPRPYAIGIAFQLGRLDTIRPLSHDIPMDYIVTEAGSVQRGDR